MTQRNAIRDQIILFTSLAGPQPPELGSLSSLRVLFLYNYKLTGPLPEEYGQ